MSDPATVPLQDLLAADEAAEEGFLAELIKVPSDNPPGDGASPAEHAAALLEGLGFTVERHPVPAELVRAHGLRSVTNLVVRERFGDGPTVALNAHGDVVPPGTGWTHDPYGAEIVDGWIYGRGAAVSKSDIAAYAFALRALRRSGMKLRGSVELHVTYDEETGGELGPGWLLANDISCPDMAIGPGFSYAVVNAHNGCLHLEVEVRGRSAHAARPVTGADALEAATAALAALYAHRRSLQQIPSLTDGIGAPQLTVGLIEGGINTNVVPDRVTFRLDRRIVPEEIPGQVETELGALIHGAVRAFPEVSADVRRILLARPLMPLPGSARLAEALRRRAREVFREHIPITGVPLYTDARHYAERGIPIVLYGAGPRTLEEANAHRADERVALADLHGATRVVALALADLLRA